MTKDKLREELAAGKTMDELFSYTPGDGCMIFKAETFKPGGEIIYIPDMELNRLATDRPATSEGDVENILDCCYTGDDFAFVCRAMGVDEKYAERLFHLCDWQHPSSVLAEGWPDDEDA